MTDLTTEGAAQPRVCRRCSVQSTASGDFCPNCGTSYVRRRRPQLTRRRIVAAVAVPVLVVALAGGVIVKRSHDQGVRDDRAAAAERAAEQEADEAEAAQQAADDAERASRAKLVSALESNITKHAKKAVKDDLLDGPILSASCTATGGGSTDDLTALTGTFDCMAINKKNDDGTMSGYGYAGTIDWQSGELTWQLGG